MIVRIAIAVIVIGIAWFYMARMRRMPEDERKDFIKRALLWGFAGFVVIMVLAGRAQWFLAPIAVILPFLQRGAGLLRHLPRLFRFLPMVQAVLKAFYGPAAAAGQSGPGRSGGRQRGQAGAAMSREQAAEILGVAIDASSEEVIEAHRRLIQKLHPDRGGSDALAAQINDAKRILLGE